MSFERKPREKRVVSKKKTVLEKREELTHSIDGWLQEIDDVLFDGKNTR